MSPKETAGISDASSVRTSDRVSTPPLLKRKSVLLGMLTSGLVVANAASPSKAAAVTTASTRSDTIWVDDMVGANDDAKFSAALAIAAGQTFPPTIRFGNREYTLAVGGHTPFQGMRIVGQEGFNNPERGGYATGSRLRLSCTGGWFVNPGTSNIYSTYFGGLSFLGGSNASVLTQGTGGLGGMFCFGMHNISASGLKTVLGTQAQALVIDAAQFDGGLWEVNNCYDGAFHLSGSDNVLWPQGMLLDSATGYVGAGQYHLWCDSLDKTYIGPLYITCEGDWGGIKVSGPAYRDGALHGNAGTVFVHGARIEGRNPTQSCNGAAIRVEGGQLALTDCWMAYAMANPGAMPNHSTTDAGYIHQTRGRLVVTGGVYDRANGQAETVPFVYSAGGSARVRDLSTAARSGTWSGLPRVMAAGGTVNVDDTATKI